MITLPFWIVLTFWMIAILLLMSGGILIMWLLIATNTIRGRIEMTPETQAKIDLVRGWYEGHSDSAIIEELAQQLVNLESVLSIKDKTIEIQQQTIVKLGSQQAIKNGSQAQAENGSSV